MTNFLSSTVNIQTVKYASAKAFENSTGSVPPWWQLECISTLVPHSGHVGGEKQGEELNHAGVKDPLAVHLVYRYVQRDLLMLYNAWHLFLLTAFHLKHHNNTL